MTERLTMPPQPARYYLLVNECTNRYCGYYGTYYPNYKILGEIWGDFIGDDKSISLCKIPFSSRNLETACLYGSYKGYKIYFELGWYRCPSLKTTPMPTPIGCKRKISEKLKQ